ncbi:penicillin-binding transpeptidase domain-containing protein [Metabacillus malikii]|uniref:serine-type D-Ala-D-Ala carboxypeptidase n=1 Tax=Metabacillus malikii TaxID=1504265 RepID=A0ABT9ZB20_9BACI|nr:penicillin-binding transpeptidase domain-containing protein [Metabacillus malikii]MDQ0229464.1 penicillin-binding protein [Metabacillus malikii]
MKKYLFGLIIVISIIILSACSNKPTASERFSEYIELWNDQKYDEMYELLSSNTKESITKEDFIGRYQAIYDGISAKNVKITFKKPAEEKDQDDLKEVIYTFSLSMETVAGEVNFEEETQLVKENRDDEENWYITWEPSMIFPQLEEDQEVKVSSIPAIRGQIFDQNNKGLAINGTAYEIGIVPQDLPEDRDETLTELSKLLNLSVEEIEGELSRSWVKPDLFVPIKRIDPTNIELYEKVMALPSIQKKDVDARVYPLGEAAAHLTGYIGSITAEQLEELKDKGYHTNSLVGKAGLEQVYEERLKGKDGYTIYVDGSNEVIAQKDPVNGEDIKITINSDIQKALYDQINGDAGTAVALHPKTGETLAMVSSPSYNPNDFILGMSSEKYNDLANNPQRPLMARFNKTFSPGSSLKPLTAAIGLETATISAEDVKVIKGKTWKKDDSWGNYSITRVSESVENVNLQNALLYSDNIYFAMLALDIGNQKFPDGLKSFGFEEEIDFPFPISKSTISSEALTNEQLLADSGYGQGQIQMSPFHLAATYTTFINEGNMVKPFLEYTSEQKDTPIWKENIIATEHVNTILGDLEQVVHNPNGTGYEPVVKGIQLAGKTGTAELKQSKSDESGTENGWFVAVNTNDPSLLIAMMVEDVKGRGGSHHVVPKVKQVFKTFTGTE